MVRYLLVKLKQYFINKDQDNLIIYLKFDRIFSKKAKINFLLIKLSKE